MKAMIFAAGLGSRLKPLTCDRPKALVEIGGQTLLEINLRKLVAEGIDEVVVNVHHFGDMVIDYLNANDGFGAKIYISDERDTLLDTGGAIKYARRFLEMEDNFLVFNVDIISDINLGELYKKHIQRDAVATLAVRERKTDRQLLFDNDGRMRGWINLKIGETKPLGLDIRGLDMYAYSGVQMVNKDIFTLMPEEAKFSIIDYYLKICDEKEVAFFNHTYDKWFDIGTVEKLNDYLSVI